MLCKSRKITIISVGFFQTPHYQSYEKYLGMGWDGKVFSFYTKIASVIFKETNEFQDKRSNRQLDVFYWFRKEEESLKISCKICSYLFIFQKLFPGGRGRGDRGDDHEEEYHRGGGNSQSNKSHYADSDNRRRGYSDKRSGGSNQNRRSDNRNRNDNNPAISQQQQQPTSNHNKIDELHHRESRDVSSIDRGKKKQNACLIHRKINQNSNSKISNYR